MRSTGMVRRIDDLGRVQIPKEIRQAMHIVAGDPLEIYTDGDDVVCFKRYMPFAQYDRVIGELADDLREEVKEVCITQKRSVELQAAADLLDRARDLIRMED